MTKKHFIRAAQIINAIREGHWTNDPPSWGKVTPNGSDVTRYDFDTAPYVRAVQASELFINLASEFNPRFDVNRFLIACGLKDAPAKRKRSTRATSATRSPESINPVWG